MKNEQTLVVTLKRNLESFTHTFSQLYSSPFSQEGVVKEIMEQANNLSKASLCMIDSTNKAFAEISESIEHIFHQPLKGSATLAKAREDFQYLQEVVTHYIHSPETIKSFVTELKWLLADLEKAMATSCIAC